MTTPSTDWWTSMSETMSAYVPSAFTSADASATTANATGTTSSDLADEEFRKRAIARMDADTMAELKTGKYSDEAQATMKAAAAEVSQQFAS